MDNKRYIESNFSYSPEFKNMEILHTSEYSRLEGAWSHVRYYLLGPLDRKKMLDSIVTRKDGIFEIYNQICGHYVKLSGTSTVSLVVNLVSLSRFNLSDIYCSKRITELRGIKQKFIQGRLSFPEILYMVVFLMMLEAESGIKDKICTNGK